MVRRPVSGSTRSSGTEIALDVGLERRVRLVLPLVGEDGLTVGAEEQSDGVVGRDLELARDVLVVVAIGGVRDGELAHERPRLAHVVLAVHAEERDALAELRARALEGRQLLAARIAPRAPL